MNVKRGLFRVWIVLSVLWVLIEGTIQLGKLTPYPQHSNVTVATAARAIENAVDYKLEYMKQKDCAVQKDEMEHGDLEYVGDIDCSSLHDNNQFNPDLYIANIAMVRVRDCIDGFGMAPWPNELVTMSNCQLSIPAGTDPKVVVSLIQSVEMDQKASANRTRQRALTVVLLPPLVLLALWWLLAWVIKGFKTS